MMNHLNNHYWNDSYDAVDVYNHVAFEHEYFVMLVELFQLQYLFDRLKETHFIGVISSDDENQICSLTDRNHKSMVTLN